MSEDEDAGEIFESGQWETFWCAASGDDEFGVVVRFPRFCGDGFGAEVCGDDFVGDEFYICRRVPVFGSEGDLFCIGYQSFGEFCAVNWKISFVGYESYGSRGAEFAKLLDRAKSSRAAEKNCISWGMTVRGEKRQRTLPR